MRARAAVVCLILVFGCEGKKKEAERKEPSTFTTRSSTSTSTLAGADARGVAAAGADAGALEAREGGPDLATCERAADHLKSLFMNVDPGSSEAQLEYARRLLDANRERVLRYCLEIAAVKEIECVLAAKQADGLVGCERMRRTIDEKLATATELTEADCARFFDRLRQFKLGEGVAPGEIDRDRDQIIRSCQEKANPGTVACFIASPTYEQARRCP